MARSTLSRLAAPAVSTISGGSLWFPRRWINTDWIETILSKKRKTRIWNTRSSDQGYDITRINLWVRWSEWDLISGTKPLKLSSIARSSVRSKPPVCQHSRGAASETRITTAVVMRPLWKLKKIIKGLVRSLTSLICLTMGRFKI